MNSSFVNAPIEQTTLTTVVRRILGSATATLGEWQAEPITHRVINRVTASLQRVTGVASDRGECVSWSVVLKTLHNSTEDVSSIFNSSSDPMHWNYWQREALAYTSGILDNLTNELAVPRCFATTESSANVVNLWLEDIEGVPASAWSLNRFGLAARHIGHLQLVYSKERSLPSAPWLSRGWHRAWVSNIQTTALEVVQDLSAWQHPLLKQVFPVTAANAVMRLWSDRDTLLAAVDKAPRTLCHFDIAPGNLFARHSVHGSDQTVLIDWSYVGYGALAEDIANLVLDSVFLLFVEHSSLVQLEQLVFEGYLTGLRSAGWDGDEHTIRFVYCAVAALHFGLLAGGLLRLVRDESRHRPIEQRFGKAFDDIITSRAVVINHALNLADEARLLLPLL